MGYLFPVNPVGRPKIESETMAIEKIGDEEKSFKNDQNNSDEDFDQLQEKVSKLINDKKIMEAIELSGLDIKTKTKLLKIVKEVASSFLRKELLNIAKSILTISLDENLEDEIDEEDLPFSEHLARLVIKLAKNKTKSPEKFESTKVKKANSLEDKNAGFLVHYCKDILNQKMKQQKNRFKLEKLNKKDIIKYLKK